MSYILTERTSWKNHLNNKYKRLTLDKEVRLRNSYVVKANRIEYMKMVMFLPYIALMMPETLG